jgi:hypothetical protein
MRVVLRDCKRFCNALLKSGYICHKHSFCTDTKNACSNSEISVECWRTPSLAMWHRVAVVRFNLSEERIASITRVTKIGKLRTKLAITGNRSTLRRNVVPSSPILVTLMMEAIRSSATSVLTIATRRHIPEADVLHGLRRRKLKPCRMFFRSCSLSLLSPAAWCHHVFVVEGHLSWNWIYTGYCVWKIVLKFNFLFLVITILLSVNFCFTRNSYSLLSIPLVSIKMQSSHNIL